ncbi:hypothetical protein NKJ72_07465 [Mesorhizobium sp. M0045]|uniref:hypothetical protein n=1 Tax=unclassified Mesorhizobium TaxID=325217 RepID=UPI0020CA1C82|nr:hypothetical protein [Mesorhizobium sp. LMG 17147]MCP9231929.1 hypothetical protein [Mesorhizobium sp. LMG 17147]
MSTKPPPVPPENLSPKGAGDKKPVAADQAPHGQSTVPDPDKQGQQGNTKVNTTHQGNVQDR